MADGCLRQLPSKLMTSSALRADGRKADQLRTITFEAGIAPHATGSVLVSFGQTRVICAATIEPKVPAWMKQQRVPGGWLTARTASITGAYLAARLAIQTLLDAKRIPENPLVDSVAAVSVGLFEGRELLDLPYLEDKDAEVDFNIVMTGQGKFVEVQGSGEEATYTYEQLLSLIALAQKGIKEVSALQTAFLTKHLLAR
jgi:ribonuclease PH